MNESYEVDELPHGSRKEIAAADRELLELAARALGAVQAEEVEGEGYLNLHMADGSTIYAWNPLVHSDDAFNLQAALQMHVGYGSRDTADVTVSPTHNIWVTEWKGQDVAAATRRAVTRAAAEIGKQRS